MRKQTAALAIILALAPFARAETETFESFSSALAQATSIPDPKKSADEIALDVFAQLVKVERRDMRAFCMDLAKLFAESKIKLAPELAQLTPIKREPDPFTYAQAAEYGGKIAMLLEAAEKIRTTSPDHAGLGRAIMRKIAESSPVLSVRAMAIKKIFEACNTRDNMPADSICTFEEVAKPWDDLLRAIEKPDPATYSIDLVGASWCLCFYTDFYCRAAIFGGADKKKMETQIARVEKILDALLKSQPPQSFVAKLGPTIIPSLQKGLDSLVEYYTDTRQGSAIAREFWEAIVKNDKEAMIKMIGEDSRKKIEELKHLGEPFKIGENAKVACVIPQGHTEKVYTLQVVLITQAADGSRKTKTQEFQVERKDGKMVRHL